MPRTWLCFTVSEHLKWPILILLECLRVALYNVIILQKEKVPENPSLQDRVLRDLVYNHGYYNRWNTFLQWGNAGSLYVSYDIFHCPDCGMTLKHCDYKCRIMKKEGGNKHFIQIERLKYEQYHRLHVSASKDGIIPQSNKKWYSSL